MTIHVKGDLTRTMKPGDHVVVTGAYLPQPILRRGRHTTQTQLQGTVLHATAVEQLKESYAEHVITEAVRVIATLRQLITTCRSRQVSLALYQRGAM